MYSGQVIGEMPFLQLLLFQKIWKLTLAFIFWECDEGDDGFGGDMLSKVKDPRMLQNLDMLGTEIVWVPFPTSLPLEKMLFHQLCIH